jgi:dipeptidyl aminopeptidase/acylaminoacyl peptidase
MVFVDSIGDYSGRRPGSPATPHFARIGGNVRRRIAMRLPALTIYALFALSSSSFAESVSYRMPPKGITDIADAPPTPEVILDPTGRFLLVLERPALSSIAELSREELRLAGIRFHPSTNARSRRNVAISARILRLADGSERAVQGLAEAPRIDDASFSPDGAHFAFTHTTDGGMELWVAGIATATAKRIASDLNGVFEDVYRWRSDSRTLVVRTIPKGRGEGPAAPGVPSGPVVQETTGEAAAAWTYQDLLETPHDEDLFEHYGTAQIVEVDLDGKSTMVGAPALASRAEPSPDGSLLLVERLERPFSYLVPYERFAKRVEVWERSGKLVREVARIPLAENVPLGRNAVALGPREIQWRPDEDGTLFWVEAQDGGDPKAQASVRDKLFSFSAPFDSEPRELASFGLRFGEAFWGEGPLALVREWWWADRRERLWKLDPTEGGSSPKLLFDYSYEDRYRVPGRPMTEKNARGFEVLLTAGSGKTLFLTAEGASPEGDRPFVDALDVSSGKTMRIFQSEAPYYEEPVAFVHVDSRTLLTRRESPNDPPNYILRSLSDGAIQAVTRFPHPYPGLVGASRELVRYARADGVQLSATLHLPPGYSPEKGGLPLFVWAYPIEFKSADAAGQVTESPYRFPRVTWGSPLYWLAEGWAIMENATMPIVGEGDKEPNDSYVEQLVSSAQAAVDEAARRGVADPERAAIGGHSYGAFMTANLLAHSDIFRAGVARSGAYNRTLTPFGFQAEQRTFWEAPEVYFKMSPFMHADQVNEPILLIHGEADNNSGTFPIQSQRLFHALKGHGAKARLVLLPHESHGYRARESVMHTLWEMNDWLEKYVKNAPPRKATTN